MEPTKCDYVDGEVAVFGDGGGDVAGDVVCRVINEVADDVAKVGGGGKGEVGEWSPICQVVTNG